MVVMHDAGATVTGSTVTVEGCGSSSLQGDVRFAEVMGLMGAKVDWHPYSITITGQHSQSIPSQVSVRSLPRAQISIHTLSPSQVCIHSL